MAADLFEDLADAEIQSTVNLWEDEQGLLAGFSYVSNFDNLVVVFDEGLFTSDIQDTLIDCAVQAVRLRAQKRGEKLTLDIGAREDDAARLAFLERIGFIRQDETSVLLARRLDEYIPTPGLQVGFTIRPIKGESELEDYVALHRAAFKTEYMTVEYRRAIINAPDYLPDLDLVAIAPSGRMAGFCVCQIFPDDAPRAGGQREAWVDPVGTHPKYQFLGLAKAMILTGMHLLKARGIDTALLSTTLSNTAMLHTAESVGFRAVSTMRWYSKAV